MLLYSVILLMLLGRVIVLLLWFIVFNIHMIVVSLSLSLRIVSVRRWRETLSVCGRLHYRCCGAVVHPALLLCVSCLALLLFPRQFCSCGIGVSANERFRAVDWLSLWGNSVECGARVLRVRVRRC